MTPTAKLRFVERDSYSHNGEFFTHPHKETILQQWWEEPNILETSYKTDEKGQPYIGYKYKGEWRDVPLEQEQA
jgi:hypothetical protein